MNASIRGVVGRMISRKDEGKSIVEHGCALEMAVFDHLFRDRRIEIWLKAKLASKAAS
jgi:hypothetical protein